MVTDRRDSLYEGVNSEGNRVRRPKSPHLTIYKFRLSMLMSIGNRLAGVASTAGLGVFAYWLRGLARGGVAYQRSNALLRHPVARLTLAGWCAASIYHLVAGLRHLIWDDAHRLEKTQINKDGPRALMMTMMMTTIVLGSLTMRARRRRGSE
ncbi:MAG: succinate dehydrogenase, cytochrome b556 subunit [Acetobacteraceae bacterium]